MTYDLVDQLWSIGAAILATTALWVVYRSIQSNWPASYYSMVDYASFVKASAPMRYILFRFGPILLVTGYVASQLDRYNKPLFTFGVVLFILHTTSTTGRALWSVCRFRRVVRNRGPLAVLHLLSIVAVLATIWLSIRFVWVVSPLVPDITAVIQNLVGGAIFSVMVFAFFRVSQKQIPDIPTLVTRQRGRIDGNLLTYARSEANHLGLDAKLVESVIVAESLQRPQWFRALERQKGRVWRSGTYGIMQVKAHRPISDSQSIDKALVQYSDVFSVSEPQSVAELEKRLIRYNPSSEFVEMVVEIYFDGYVPW